MSKVEPINFVTFARHLSLFKKWLLAVAIVLTMWAPYLHSKYQDNMSGATAGLTLRDSPAIWAKKLDQCDVSTYLKVALNFSHGHGVVQTCATCPDGWAPFMFWAPGTSVLLGTVMKIFGSSDMYGVFAYAAFCHALFILLTIWTALLVYPSVFTAILAGLWIAVQPIFMDFTYSYMMASSDVGAYFSVGLMNLAMVLYFRDGRLRDEVRALVLLGLAIGVASLFRDSMVVFAIFSSTLLFLHQAWRLFRNKTNWRKVLLVLPLILLFSEIPRAPVKYWNRRRSAISTISTSSSGITGLNGIWIDYGKNVPTWAEAAGLGIGTQIDPAKGAAVNEMIRKDPFHAARFSRQMFFALLIEHPLEFFRAKVRRLPLLFWGRFGDAPWSLGSVLCVIGYLSLLGYIFACVKKRCLPNPVVFAYALFLLGASVIIHSELRYSYPALSGLACLPAAFFALFLKGREVTS
jgi:hypothetical protein